MSSFSKIITYLSIEFSRNGLNPDLISIILDYSPFEEEKEYAFVEVEECGYKDTRLKIISIIYATNPTNAIRNLFSDKDFIKYWDCKPIQKDPDEFLETVYSTHDLIEMDSRLYDRIVYDGFISMAD